MYSNVWKTMAALPAIAVFVCVGGAAQAAGLTAVSEQVRKIESPTLTAPAIEPESVTSAVPAGEFSTLSSGAWSDTEIGPNLYNAGIWSYASFTPTSTPPAGATTTYVSWTWSVGNYRSDLVVYLCNYARCGDISSWGSGGTSFFNGDSPNSEYRLYFMVPGNGEALNPPVYGQQDYVNVSWTQ